MDQTEWKRKYQQLTRDFQQLEKEQSRREKSTQQELDLLRQLIRQLTLQTQNSDPNLVAPCDTLLEALNSEQSKPLQKAAKQLDKALLKSRNLHHKSAEEILTTVRHWISELRAITEQELTLNSLDVLKNRSVDACRHYLDLPALLSNLVTLQSEIMDTLVHDETNAQALNSQALDEDQQIMLQHIATDLLDLLDGLPTSIDNRFRAQQLINQLEQGFALSELPQILHRVVKLVAECSRSQSDDFERYLREISDQLNGMQGDLARNHADLQTTGHDQIFLNERLQLEMESLQVATKRSADLIQLKSLVNSQLGQVQSGVKQLKQAEQQRQQEAQQRHEQLTVQLKTVEEEAQRTMIRVEEERLRSRIDPLTKLPNRTGYNEQLEQELQQFEQFNRPLTVAVCDIDHFKQVNDNYGHLAGDKALRLLASVLTNGLRSSDYVARYGGEEFVILMPATRCSEAARILDKLRKAIAGSPFNFKGTPVPVTVSIGVSQVQHGDTPEELFARADDLLYKAKQQGRNQLCADRSAASHHRSEKTTETS